MAEPTTAWCTPEDLMDYLSALGVSLHSDDGGRGGDDGIASPADATAVEERICLDATAEVYFYLSARYADSVLSGSRWVKRRVMDFALHALDTRRGDAATPVIQERYDRAHEVLEEIRAGKKNIGNLPLRKARGGVPTVSNQRVRLDPHPRVVTERKRSTGDPRDYVRWDDKTEWLNPAEY